MDSNVQVAALMTLGVIVASVIGFLAKQDGRRMRELEKANSLCLTEHQAERAARERLEKRNDELKEDIINLHNIIAGRAVKSK